MEGAEIDKPTTTAHSQARGPKFCSLIRNLPVVSILEGEELGKVQTLLIDSDRGLVIGFILATREMDQGIRVVPYHNVSSFGSFALTVSRSSEVTDLAGNPYFMELFERDLVLIGCKVLESTGKVVGYVQDIAIDCQDGTILLLKLSSDIGFMSPFRATVPFKAVDKIESDTITLKPNEQVNFKKDTPGGEEGYSYVPLVVEEAELKDALERRLTDEMEKVQRDAMKRLESEYERFFLAHHKDALSGEIAESLKEFLNEKIQEAFTSFRQSILDEMNPLLERLAPIEKTEEETAKRKQDIGKLRDELAEAASSQAAENTQSLGALRDDIQQRFSEIEAKHTHILEERLLSLENLLGARMENQQKKTDEKIAALTGAAAEDLLQKLDSTIEKISGEIKSVKEAVDAQANLHGELEKRLESAISEIPVVDTEKIGLIDEIREQQEELEKNFSFDLEQRARELASTLRQEIEKATESLETQFGELSSELQDSVKRPGDAIGKFNAKLERLREMLENVAQEPPRILSEFDSRLDEVIDSLREDLQASIDRLTEKNERTWNKNLELEERVNSDISEFQNALRRSADNLGEINKLIEEKHESSLQQVQSTLAPIREQLGEQVIQSARDMDVLSKQIMELEQKIEAYREPHLPKEQIRNMVDTIIEQKTSGIRNDLDETLEGKISEIQNMFDPGLEELKKSTAELESLKADIEELKARPGSEAVKNQIEEQANTINALSEKLAEIEKQREPAQETISLLDRSNRELRELLDAQDNKINALKEKIAELGKRREPIIVGEPTQETTDLIERFNLDYQELLEDQKNRMESLSEKLAELEKREPTAPGDSVPETAAVIEEHIDSLRQEFEKKLEAISAAADKTTGAIAEELKAQIQSGAWKQTIRESQAEFLRKTIEGERESEGEEKDETPVTDEEAVDVYGTRIAGKLLGKRVSRDIFAGTDLIIQKGRVIDESVVETAKVHGKFIELSLSVLED